MRRASIALVLVLPMTAAAVEPYNAEETAVAAFTNAARADLATMCAQCKRLINPDIDCGTWGPSALRAPLHYERRLADAARFHSRHMRDGPCFQHESCCELKRSPDGSVACAAPACDSCDFPSSCAGTDTGPRYAMLGYGEWVGENIAVGQSDAFDVICAWLDSPGHRTNILSAANDLGVGRDGRAGQCAADPYWTQGFGGRPDRPAPGFITSGGLVPGSLGEPFGPSGRAFTAVAHVHDTVAARAPLSVRAIVDGRCIALPKALGADGRGLHASSFDAAAGCHQVWFLAESSDGTRHVFPRDGAIGFAVGGASCPEPASRTTAECEGANACTAEAERRGCYSRADGTEDVGVCHGGASVCRDGAWSTCENANFPGLERCNGFDDDCDGVTDEEVDDVGAACRTTLPGRCSEGITICAGGRPVCVAGDPQAETCNGVDDDCDGSVDDGLGSTACGTGACRRVVANCSGGNAQSCVAGTPVLEICGNEVDDDCNGTPDDGCACTVPSERACYPGPASTRAIGRCAAGVQRCLAGAWGKCAGAVLPDTESCNGFDDDCNGAIDEGLGRDVCGVGTCRATRERCVGGAAQVCSPLASSAEVCDGDDDDCDGAVDEGCTCATGVTLPCSTDWLHAGVGACRAGVRTCDAAGRFGACSGEITPAVEACGNAIDDDCDASIDEGCVTEEPEVPDESPYEREGCGCGSMPVSTLAGTLALAGLRRRRDRNRK